MARLLRVQPFLLINLKQPIVNWNHPLLQLEYLFIYWQDPLLRRLGFRLPEERRHRPTAGQGRAGREYKQCQAVQKTYLFSGSSPGPCHHWHSECQRQGGGGGPGAAEVEEVSRQDAQVWRKMKLMLTNVWEDPFLKPDFLYGCRNTVLYIYNHEITDIGLAFGWGMRMQMRRKCKIMTSLCFAAI